MSPTEEDVQEEQLGAYLTDYAAALAADRSTLPPSLASTPRELLAQLEPLEALVRRLDQDRRGGESTPSTPARVFANSPESLWQRLTSSPQSIPLDTTGAGALGRFRIVREVGRGGYGVVFLAWDPILGRKVALKVPRPESLLAPELCRRFLREAQVAAGLDHPNLVPVYETGELGPIAFIVSRYCDGPTLATWLKQVAGPVSASLATRLVAVLAEAVHHAHERGILHRDLKPSNVLLEQKPGPPAGDLEFTPQITDFGLAKLVEAESGDTRSGALVGTPHYMAPEQAEGRLAEVGPHTDVYGLGAILYEVLTGQPPLNGTTQLDVLRRILTDEPASPRRLRPDVPRDLEAICLKCLEKVPGRRYASAAELAADLHRFLTGKPTVARPLGAAGRAQRWVRRRPAAAAWLGLLFLALSSFGLGTWGYLRSLHDYAEARSATDQQRALAEAHDLLNRRLNYAADLADLGNRWKAGKHDDLRQRLDRLRPGPGEPDLRGFEWHYLRQQVNPSRVLHLPRRMEDALCYSHDGRILASSSRDDVIQLWDAQSGRPLSRLKGLGGQIPNRLCFSQNGHRLVTAVANRDGGTVQVWLLPTGRSEAQWFTPGNEAYQATISKYGETVAVGGTRSGPARVALVQLFDTRTKSARIVWQQNHPESNVTALCLSPDGRLLAVAYHVGPRLQIDLIRLPHGQVQATMSGHSQFVFGLAFSPDSMTLASGCADQTVKLWDVATAKNLATLVVEEQRADDVRADIRTLAFSPDGRTLAAGWVPQWEKGSDADCRVSLWDVASRKRLPAEFRPGCAIASLSFSPDGKTLAVGDKSVHLWDMAPQSEFLTLAGTRQREAWSVAISSDCSTLAAGYDDEQGGDRKTLQLWDMQTGRVRATLTGHRSMVFCAAFTPDGSTITSAGHDKTVRLWDAQTGRLQHTLHGHTDKVRSVACSPDGQTLASGGRDKTVRLWDRATGRQQFMLAGHKDWVFQVAFSPDGKTLASASLDGSVRIWDVVTGEPIRIFTDTSQFYGAAYSPDGKTLATCNNEGIIKLWDLVEGQERARLEGHLGSVHMVAYSPDGKTLASGGADRSVRWWQAETGRPLLAFENLPEQVHGLAFSADGCALAAALHDGSIRIWRADKD